MLRSQFSFPTMVLLTALSVCIPLLVAADDAMAAEAIEFEAMVVPAREAEITPIVSGWLNKINFAPGDFVQQGDVLFEFNLVPKKLNVRLAEAQLKRAQASLRNAEAKLQRAKTLEAREVTSRASLLEAESTRDIALADVEAMKAALELQKLALIQSTQRAPFSGIMSAPLVLENGFQNVSGREHLRMATITQLDPIRVIGRVPYSLYAERRRELKNDEAIKQRVVLSIILPDGELYPHEGKLVSGGYKFDEKTQQITVWGEFSNPDRFLRPGLRVRVRSSVR